jgi:hypothetical protein
MSASARSRFDMLDAELGRGDLGPELGDVPFEDLAPAALVGACGLDASEGLGDCLIFLVEPIEAPIELVEVAEPLGPDIAGPLLEPVEPLVEPIKAPVDRDEAPIDGREPPAREFDAVLGSGARHDERAAARLAPCSGPAPAARFGDTAR